MSRPLLVWAYMVELVAAGSVLAALCLWLSPDQVVTFVRSAAIDIATLFGAAMFTGALAFLWTFFSKADTPFYRWLETKGAFRAYLTATIYTVAISFLATASLVLTKYIDHRYVGLAATFLLLLAVINLYTLVSTVADLMRLNAAYERMQRDA